LWLFWNSFRLTSLKLDGTIIAVVRSVKNNPTEEQHGHGLEAIEAVHNLTSDVITLGNETPAQTQERNVNLKRQIEELTQELQRANAGRKRAEEELRETQGLYHSLVEQLPINVYRKDAEGRFTFVNSRFCRIKGMRADQILGQMVFAVDAKELAEQSAGQHELIMRTGKSIELEESYPLPDGTMQFYQVVKLPVFSADGRIIGTQGIHFDITRRKQVEAELAFERDLLETLLENIPDLIYFKDLQSRFLRFTKSFAHFFGVDDPETLRGKSDADFFSEEHARPAFEDEQEIIRTGKPLIGKVEKETHTDGRVTWALTSKMPWRNKNGNIIGTFGISKDITAIKETEIKLEAVYRQLVDTSRQAGMAEVATSVLHNVGNVLNSVNVSSSLISEKVRSLKISNVTKAVALMRAHENNLNDFLANDPKGKQLPSYLSNLAAHLAQEQEDILREADSLASNIIHIKEIVAMQQNYAKTSGVLESLKIVDLVEDAIRMNTGAMTRHNVKVVRDFAEVPPILVEKHKVLQILVNLIRNAKYACDDSGKTDKQISLRVANGNGRIKISVADNGIGIPPENLTRIFSHGFTTRKEGHGFGLHSGALSAKEMGGSLAASSDGPGHGATFTLELPIQKQK
jgi:PAS domain S-box-containing protein